MSKEKKQVYIQEMKTTFDKSEAVIVAHYQGLTVSQLDELRSKMREHGIQFKITKKLTSRRGFEWKLNSLQDGQPRLGLAKPMLFVQFSFFSLIGFRESNFQVCVFKMRSK